MKLLIDMNLSPLWVEALEARDFVATQLEPGRRSRGSRGSLKELSSLRNMALWFEDHSRRR